MSSKKRKGGFWNRLVMVVAIALLALLSLSFIVHIPMVQTWGIRQISTYITKKTDSKVEIRKFDFNIFRHFAIDDFFLGEPGNPTDTLLYANRLEVRFANLWSLTRNKLYLKEVALKNSRLDFQRNIDNEVHSLAQVLTRLFEKDPARVRKKGELVLLVGRVSGENLDVRYVDHKEQTIQEFSLPEIMLDVDVIDFKERHMIVDVIEMESPRIRIEHLAKPGVRDRKQPQVEDSLAWDIMVCHLGTTDGIVQLVQPSEDRPLQGVDYNDMQISELDLQLNDFYMRGLDMGAVIGHLSFREASGFEITSMRSLDASLTREAIVLNDLELLTPDSRIGHTLSMSFDDIGKIDNFADDVQIYGEFDDTRIAISDLLLAIPSLQNSPFFASNTSEDIVIDGIVRGTINRLRGEAINGALGPLKFKGSFRSRNLTITDEQILNLQVDEARFSAQGLSQTIPGLVLPDQFDKLGQMRFAGRFDGFFEDFVAFGKFKSRLGDADLDMRLDLKPGRTLAQYSGNIELINFDLNTWTGNPDLGSIHVQARVEEGSGLTAESANARLSGVVHTLAYKGYIYEDVRLNGLLDKNFFDGSLAISTDEIDLDFLGTVDFREEVPQFDFGATVRQLDLQALNLADEPFSISGRFDVAGAYENINTIDGYATAADVHLIRGVREEYTLDTISLVSQRRNNGARYLRVTSDYINGTVEGIFDFINVYPELAAHLHGRYPDRIPAPKRPLETGRVPSDFNFNLVLKQSSEWISLLGVDNVTFKDLAIQGRVDMNVGDVRVIFDMPELHVNNINFYEARGELGSYNGEATGDVAVTAFDLNEKHFFDEVAITFSGNNNTLDWHLITEDVLASVNTVDLKGSISQDADGLFHAHIEPQELMLFNNPWNLNPNNEIIWDNGYISVKDFALEHLDEHIILRSVKNRGVLLDIEGFNAAYINEVWNYDRLDFAGEYSMTVVVEDVFQRQGFYVWLSVPDFQINNDTYGNLLLDARMEVAGMPVQLSLDIDKEGSHLNTVGWYYPPIDEVHLELHNTLDVNVKMDTFPLNFLDYVMGDGIRDTEGSLIGDVRIFGKLGDLDMTGDLVTDQGATTISYLGTRYTFHGQPIRITRNLIDMDGAILIDRAGNTGRISGGITHDLFSNFGLNARIVSDKLVSLNTTKRDNPLYYGYGVGAIDARFTGSTALPNISVDAVAQQGTRVAIAVSNSTEVRDETFIRFINKDSASGPPEPSDGALIKGMNFEMNLTVTPEALVQIIFDEQTEDIIHVNGQGDLQLEITRSGEFNMYGAYEVDRGDYLFTNLILNKPFEISRGGSLRWSGDPFDAVMDIEAKYTGLRTSLTTFLEEYLINASPAAREEASLKRSVELTMYLTGSLLEPEINFDIRFPELTGELAGYADSKLRILEANENALNEQVFGLLWAGTFLPSNVLQSQSTSLLAESGIYNTLSEFFSNQLSSFLSEFLERAVEDVDFISGIDFDVGFNRSYDFDLQSYSYSEWELRMKNRLFDDRIILDVGGNYVTDSPIAGTYFAGDYALEYILTADRRLKVRFYHRNEETIEGRKSKFGRGLSYRREFDSFGDWLSGLDKEAKKLKGGASDDSSDPNDD